MAFTNNEKELNRIQIQQNLRFWKMKLQVKVMGQGIYEDYSKALDNALKNNKGVFAIGGVLFFITSLFL